MNKNKITKTKIEKTQKNLETKVRANLDGSVAIDQPILKISKKKELMLPDNSSSSKMLVKGNEPTLPRLNSNSKENMPNVSLPKLATSNRTKSSPATEIGSIARAKNRRDIIDLPPNDDTYFVYLNAPLEYRRHLLESSRKILFCLKSHQKIMFIRQKKFEELKRLRAALKELLYLNKKFREKLPKYHAEFLGHTLKGSEIDGNISRHKAPTMPVFSSNATKPKDITREKTELEKLEDSLASIELKLKNL